MCECTYVWVYICVSVHRHVFFDMTFTWPIHVGMKWQKGPRRGRTRAHLTHTLRWIHIEYTHVYVSETYGCTFHMNINSCVCVRKGKGAAGHELTWLVHTYARTFNIHMWMYPKHAYKYTLNIHIWMYIECTYMNIHWIYICVYTYVYVSKTYLYTHMNIHMYIWMYIECTYMNIHWIYTYEYTHVYVSKTYLCIFHMNVNSCVCVRKGQGAAGHELTWLKHTYEYTLDIFTCMYPKHTYKYTFNINIWMYIECTCMNIRMCMYPKDTYVCVSYECKLMWIYQEEQRRGRTRTHLT